MKKSISVILSTILAFAFFQVPVSTAALAEASVPTIRIMNRLNPEVSVDDSNLIIKALEDKLGINIEYEAVAVSAYSEKEQLIMASGDLPDIIYHHGAADAYLETWAKEGTILALDDYLPNYPNLMSQVTPEMQEAMRSTATGKIMSIARPNMVNYNGFVINNDWLKALGLEAPATIDDFKKTMIAFATEDPDGDGKKNTYGMIMGTNCLTDYTNNGLASAFGLSYIADPVTGAYNIIQRMSGYVPYLTFLREMYEAGAIDPEWVMNAESSEKLRSGTVGCIPALQTTALAQCSYLDDSLVLDKYNYIAPMENIYTNKATCYSIPAMWGCYMINAESENIDKCLALIDYCMSEEGFILTNLGIEGVTYNSYDIATHTIDRTSEQAALLNTMTSSYFTFEFAHDGLPAIYTNTDTAERLEKFTNEFKAVLNKIDHINVPYQRAPLLSTFDADHPDVSSTRQTKEIEYIMGEISLEDFEQYLTDELYPVTEEANADYAVWMAANDVKD
ncbi:MAG: extracellular solute-binding protein [Eubacteriales bacterium]|nr:extracellular solute-binding protein [Eubacteriales bacterium]